jgi:hypothetical protein
LARQLKVFIVGSAKVDYSKDILGDFNNQLLSLFEKYHLIISNLAECDLFISINHSNQAYREFQKSGKKKNQAILIRSEPDVVFPAQYTERIINKYGLVITLGNKEKDDGSFYYIQNPYSYLPNPNSQMARGLDVKDILESIQFNELFEFDNWQKREIILSLIASNKVSCVRNSNYGLRRDLAVAFPKDFLNIYGELWNSNIRNKLQHRVAVVVHGIFNLTVPNLISIYGSFFRKYKNYVSPLGDKHVIVRQSKFSLVIENSNDYISEKIFDALINGSIPIYIGPELEEKGIPGKDIAIAYEGSPKMLEYKIRNLSNNEVKKYLDSIKKFLNSKDFIDNWIDHIVYRKIADKIQEFYKEQNSFYK